LSYDTPQQRSAYASHTCCAAASVEYQQRLVTTFDGCGSDGGIKPEATTHHTEGWLVTMSVFVVAEFHDSTAALQPPVVAGCGSPADTSSTVDARRTGSSSAAGRLRGEVRDRAKLSAHEEKAHRAVSARSVARRYAPCAHNNTAPDHAQGGSARSSWQRW
jgi:hypothetical protein